MKVVGLIVEYNPLHNGHFYHFLQSKKITQADAVVIVMSGNFLQRGEPALVDKWARTEMALRMGADLVFELPYVYATQQAEYFAFGAISLLHRLPFVTDFTFGSESGAIDQLRRVAELLTTEPDALRDRIRAEVRLGKSYPRAYSDALQQYATHVDVNPDLISKPNNILGLHYIISLLRLNSRIRVSTIRREKAGYHDLRFSDSRIASATSIRKAIFEREQIDWETIKNFVPSFTYDILLREYENKGLVSWDSFFPYLRYAFLSHSPEQLKEIYEMEEGIENRFKTKVKLAQSTEHFVQLVKTKRYTWNRIQRMMLHTFLQFTKKEAHKLAFQQGPTYFRLLGYSEQGRALLNEYKKRLPLPLISALRQNHPPMLEWDLKAAALYSLGYKKRQTDQFQTEQRMKPLALNAL